VPFSLHSDFLDHLSISLRCVRVQLLDGMERSVWLIARPIRFATIFGFQFVSHGTYPFCHWAVLVTSLDFEAIKSALTDTSAEKDDIQLGSLWRISRREDGTCPLDNIRPFCVSNAKDEWNVFSAEYIGKTLKSDDEIEYEGTPLYIDNPLILKPFASCMRRPTIANPEKIARTLQSISSKPSAQAHCVQRQSKQYLNDLFRLSVFRRRWFLHHGDLGHI
jgi:hypothetical protein